ncbi:MAG: MBL fold metallo-hydrolase [Actinobacteria bacterium]|nr:MBL fold metallo-hydrolase [Actinomycetota bacterium]MBW3650182.1 MBL fold metallo-hydrolase [Actinomycetota bacterium]
MPLWLAHTNAWIVSAQGAGGECVLVDAPPDPRAILDRLDHHGIRLVALLTTHGHIDHVGGIAEVVKAQNQPVPVRLHQADHYMLDDPVGTSGAFGRFLEQAGLDLRPPEVVEGITDGERISGAGMTFTALHTPGHTEGSVCFLLEAEGHQPVMFSGDHLFKGSIGRFDLPGGSFEKLMASMAEKILPLDDDIAVLPGHGQSTTIGHERRTNPFLLQLRHQLGQSLS